MMNYYVNFVVCDCLKLLILYLRYFNDATYFQFQGSVVFIFLLILMKLMVVLLIMVIHFHMLVPFRFGP